MSDSESSSINKANFAAYKDLARPFTLLMPFVGFLAGAGIAYFAIKPESIGIGLYINILLGAIAAPLLNVASNAINQYYDYDIDCINKPDRPLPSGRMLKITAIRFGIGAYILAIILASFINMPVLIVVVITALITYFYSAPPIRFKNNPVLANVAMAIPRGLLLPVVGWFAVHPDKLTNSTPWAIGSILFLYVLGAASTKDYADMKGDEACGARTLPVVLGVKRSAWVISPSFVIPFLLIPVFIHQGLLEPHTFPLTLLSIWGLYIAWLILRNPESLALEGNHPSWKHMYLLTMAMQLGFLASYAIGCR
jgi:4-hydroxybenzoate polyprenyltransferase